MVYEVDHVAVTLTIQRRHRTLHEATNETFKIMDWSELPGLFNRMFCSIWLDLSTNHARILLIFEILIPDKGAFVMRSMVSAPDDQSVHGNVSAVASSKAVTVRIYNYHAMILIIALSPTLA